MYEARKRFLELIVELKNKRNHHTSFDKLTTRATCAWKWAGQSKLNFFTHEYVDRDAMWEDVDHLMEAGRPLIMCGDLSTLSAVFTLCRKTSKKKGATTDISAMIQ
jgi:hypothetical protein